ncbi:MAG: aminotransferase class V-fold PLP-dependent enzyme [Clostridiales bacterium]|nr:aminotransferase class V-fold PLP-dependent enzyme [Clostridiales bacterium]
MIFLDSAATTLQKPPAVAKAVARAMGTLASPGRGGYPAAERAAEVVYRCRETAARLFGAAGPEQVVLTTSATHGLNIAIRSLAKSGGRAVISGYEHNAVTRTLASLPEVQVDVARGRLFHPEELVAAFERLLPGADFAVCCHVSNVFGYILPLEEIAGLCRQYGVPLVVDAAQSAGTIPLNMEALGAAYLAMPGHKGLYGPQGTGLLLCAPEIGPLPLLTGGTGSDSKRQEMPDFLPDRLEAGTHNVPGAAGLTAGMTFVQSVGVERIGAREQALRRQLVRALRDVPDLYPIESPRPELQSGVLSLVSKTHDVEELAGALGQRGICVRAGYHCAPLAHESGGTLASGTVRISFSAFNREEEVRRLAEALAELTGSAH